MLVGYVGSQTVLDGSDMMNIAVDAHYRRQGIAQALVEALVAQLKEKGNHSLTLEVRISNQPAIALYEKLGFTPVGRRKDFYRDPVEDALLMTRFFDKGEGK